MNVKPGNETTEWKALLMAVGTAILALLVGYGVLTQEEAQLWGGLLASLAPLLVMAVGRAYINSRTEVKRSAYQARLAEWVERQRED